MFSVIPRSPRSHWGGHIFFEKLFPAGVFRSLKGAAGTIMPVAFFRRRMGISRKILVYPFIIAIWDLVFVDDGLVWPTPFIRVIFAIFSCIFHISKRGIFSTPTP
jgi:hypothetical protein